MAGLVIEEFRTQPRGMGDMTNLPTPPLPLPLEDPLLRLRGVLGRTLIVSAVASLVFLGSYLVERREWLIAIPLIIVFFYMPLAFFVWRILPSRPTNAIYLRSFKDDRSSWPVRKALQEALGRAYRLSGIREPRRRRSVLDWINTLFFVFRYSTPKRMNLEAGADWKARLWQSLGSSRCAFIDLTSPTPAVFEELKISHRTLGTRRVLVIVGGEAARERSRDYVGEALGLAPARRDEVRVSCWEATKEGRERFRIEVDAFLAELPEGVPGPIPPEHDLITSPTPGVEVFVHGRLFWARYLALGYLVAVAITFTSRWFAPGLNLLAYALTLGYCIWMSVTYLIDCGSRRERILFLASLLLPLTSYGLLVPSLLAAREGRRRATFARVLLEIGLAVECYRENLFGTDGDFPRGSSTPDELRDRLWYALPSAPRIECPPERGHSWLVMILPCLENAPMFNAVNFQQPSDSPENGVFATYRILLEDGDSRVDANAHLSPRGHRRDRYRRPLPPIE